MPITNVPDGRSFYLYGWMMDLLPNNMLTTTDISQRFNLTTIGPVRNVLIPALPQDAITSGIGWAKNDAYRDTFTTGTVICERAGKNDCTYLLSEHPRLMFALIVNEYFPSLKDRIDIGKNCDIHPSAAIGSEGMGFIQTKKGNVPFPQIGGVIIENDVKIGAFTDVKRAALGFTRIGHGTKIGSHCNIGHGAQIGNHCLITQNVTIAGSATIGEFSYIGIGARIINGVTIGNNVTIGAGAVVIEDVPDNTTVVGVPAHELG